MAYYCNPGTAKQLIWIICLAALLAGSGCATVGKAILPKPPTPLTEQQIIALAHNKMPETEIIKKIGESRGVYHLKTADVLRLAQEGVPPAVIDFMMETYTQNQLAEQRARLIFRYNDPYWQEQVPRSRYYP